VLVSSLFYTAPSTSLELSIVWNIVRAPLRSSVSQPAWATAVTCRHGTLCPANYKLAQTCIGVEHGTLVPPCVQSLPNISHAHRITLVLKSLLAPSHLMAAVINVSAEVNASAIRQNLYSVIQRS